MLKPARSGSPFRRVCRSVLAASILPAALVTQVWAVDWNGLVSINVDPMVGAGLIEGRADGAFNLISSNLGDGPGRDGLAAGLSLGIFMGQDTSNFATGSTGDFDNFWNNDRTWIYSGEINSGPLGLLSFAESIDDATQIKIDNIVILKDQVWNVPTASGVLQFTPNTYHSIEIRLGNGAGEAGPVSLNNFVADVSPNGYGFGFSQTGATGTNGANYIKPIDSGSGALFQHETGPATAAGQDITVLGDSTVTLQKMTSDHLTENSIAFTQASNAVTLTVNGSTPGGTLRSLGTVLANHSGIAGPPVVPNVISIAGDADFAPGVLSTGPTAGEATLTNIVLQKNGGAGMLILDDLSNTSTLAGTTLKVINGKLSIVGGGGTLNPVSSLTTGIEIGGTTTTLTPVLRIGGDIAGTNFVNKIWAKQNGTLEHLTSGTDTLNPYSGGVAGPTLGIDQSRTLTVNVSGGGLIVNGFVTRSTSTGSSGGTLVKKGLNTTLQINGNVTLTTPETTFLTGVNADEGRLEINNVLRGPAAAQPLVITIGANGTLALSNSNVTNFNRLPTTITVSAGTLEGVPGAFTTSTGTPSILQITGGALSLGRGFSTSGLIANLYPDGDTGANTAFNSYANYVNYFVGRGPGTVTNTAANGYASLEFGLPIAQTAPGPQMFAPIASSFTEVDTLVSRMHGKIFIGAAGVYTFGAGSDDGSMIYIDGRTVVANNFYQAHARRTGDIELTAGYHDIDIGYYEGTGLNSLVIDWAGPGITGTQTIPNSVLLPFASDLAVGNNFNNQVVIPATSTSATINASLAAVASLSLSVGKTLTVNGNLFNTGPLTLSGGAGTYTFNTALFNETVVPSIVDGNAAVAIVKNGPGTLILEAPANPQLQSATSITATAGALGLVLGPNSPAGNATINANGLSLLFSSKGGDQTYALPTFTDGGSISASKLGSGVAGTSGTPIRVTLTGNLALNPGKTLNLATTDFYTLSMGGISGNATVNVNGTVETSGAVSVTGPLTAVSSKVTAAQSVSAGPITMTDSTATIASSLVSSGAVNLTRTTLTANGVSGTSLVITEGTVKNTGNINLGAGAITITGKPTVSSVLELNGGAITAGPIDATGVTIHATSGVTNAATSATFTELNPSGLFGRFVVRPGAVLGPFWQAQTPGGILAIETDKGPFTVEKPLTTALSFLPYQGADANISTFFNGAPTVNNEFAIGFFGNFTAPVSGQYQMQVTQVDDDAGWWVDRDFDGIFETAGGANGTELIAQRACCGDSAIGLVTLVAGRTYRVAIGVEDGQGGSSFVGWIGLPGEALQVIDPSNPAQDDWWHYGKPNQVVVDAGAELNMEGINGSVNVLVNGGLGLTEDSSMDSLVIGAGATVVLGGPAPAAANEPAAGAELAGDSVAVVPEPATPVLMLLGALGLAARRKRQRRSMSMH